MARWIVSVFVLALSLSAFAEKTRYFGEENKFDFAKVSAEFTKFHSRIGFFEHKHQNHSDSKDPAKKYKLNNPIVEGVIVWLDANPWKDLKLEDREGVSRDDLAGCVRKQIEALSELQKDGGFYLRQIATERSNLFLILNLHVPTSKLVKENTDVSLSPFLSDTNFKYENEPYVGIVLDFFWNRMTGCLPVTKIPDII